MLTNRAEQRPEGSIPPLLYKAQGSITFTHLNSPFSAFESLTDDNFETVLGEAGSGTCNADPNATDLYDEDGTTGIARKVFARDAYKLNLHYYDGDYSPINMPGYTAASGLANTERYDLYNGNISSMAVNIRKLATVSNSPGAAYAGAMLYNYRYDQLNRLMEVDAHATNGSFGIVSATHTPLPDYKERYSYDPNGNIKSLFRNGTSGTYAGHSTPNVAIDDLTYKYQYATTTPGVMGEYTPGRADPTDLGHYTNRLASVQDPTNLSGNYAEDIDNQAALNYTYDAIGNLIHDEKGDIDVIDWTVYGKIERIVKKDGSKIEYTYDASGNRISKTVTPPPGGGGAVITWYVRDAQGNVMSTYVAGDNSLNSAALTQTELHVYGRRRIGVLNLALNCSGNGLIMASTRTLTRGQKFFELTNHLGNVLATVTDRLIPMPDGNGTVVDYYLADVASATDYYAFGMQMPGRGYSSSAYRYGFNGKENDNEVKGNGNQQDYGMRIYDPRLGRFLSVDPLVNAYPYYTPYQFAGNKPTWMVDLDGAEENPPEYLYEQLNVDMSKAPKSFKPVHSKKTFTTIVKDGKNYNHAWAWDQIRKNNPTIKWSKGNSWRIDRGIAPKSDPLLRSQFPTFEQFKSQTMHIHHMDHGPTTSYGLPAQLHNGKGYTSLWHRFSKLLVFGLAFLEPYMQSMGDPLFANDISIPNELEFLEDATKAGISSDDYTQVANFAAANNSRTNSRLPSPGQIGIYYASADEMLAKQFPDLSKAAPGAFVTGGWGAYYANSAQASGSLNKTVTHAIIYFKSNNSTNGFVPVNAIQIAPMPAQHKPEVNLRKGG